MTNTKKNDIENLPNMMRSAKITGKIDKKFRSIQFNLQLMIERIRTYFQVTFICSKSPIETLEKGVKYIQS